LGPAVRIATVFFALTALASTGCGRIIGTDDIVFDESPSSPSCAMQRDCKRFDAADPHVCREGKCVPLLDDRPDTEAIDGSCRRVLGAENLQSSVPPFVFGAVSWGPPGDRPSVAELNYELVVREFTREAGFDVQGSTRLPVGVMCNVSNTAELDRTLDHLTFDLGLPGLLVSLPSAELKRGFARVYAEQGRQVFMLSPLVSTPLLAAVDDGGLLWHILGAPRDLARVYPPLIRRTEDYLHRKGLDGGVRELRLALLHSPRSEDVDMASYVDGALVLNGKDAAQNGDDHYRRYTIQQTATDQGKSFAEALTDLFEFRPHIVVPIGDERYLRDLVAVLEGAWGQVPDGQRAPFYLLSPYHAGSGALINALADFPSLNERVVGVSAAAARTSEVYGAYRRNLQSQYPDRTDLEGGENFYDAAYFLLFAVSAAGAVPELSGQQIGAGMTRLVAGTEFSMGQSRIGDVLLALRNPAAAIALEGTLGPPDFDVETGTRRRAEGSVWCVTRDAEQRPIFHYDVLTLDESTSSVGVIENPQTSKLVGELGCLPGF
jgi:hypothetical protein